MYFVIGVVFYVTLLRKSTTNKTLEIDSTVNTQKWLVFGPTKTLPFANPLVTIVAHQFNFGINEISIRNQSCI